MSECTQQTFAFASCGKLRVEADFHGGEVSSDGGLLLLREVDLRLNLTAGAAALLPGRRNPLKIVHTCASMLRQRVFALAQGYEYLNDHGTCATTCCSRPPPAAAPPLPARRPSAA